MRLVLVTALLAGCTPSFPPFERKEPNLLVLRDAIDGPVVFTTRGDRPPADTTCPDGTRPHLPPGAGPAERRRLANENHILPAGTERVTLVFSATDPSGVERVELGWTVAGVTPIAPADPPVVSVGLPGGGREDRCTFSYEALPGSAERPLRTASVLSIEVEIGAYALPITFTLALIDSSRGGPRNLGTRRFSVARPEAVCG